MFTRGVCAQHSRNCTFEEYYYSERSFRRSRAACHMCNNMSDVRLSNASPTVERVDARHPDTVHRLPVRRNLYGTPDREQRGRFLTDAIEDDVKAFTEKYNYDPVNDRPLPAGNYEWQEDREAPEFYRRPPHRGDKARPGPQRDVDGSRKRNAGSSALHSDDDQRTKKSHTDEEDVDERLGGAGSRALTAAAEGHSRPRNSAEVQQ